MNKQGEVIGRKGRRALKLESGSGDDPVAAGVREVLLWEAWQLHAKLRKQWMVSDPAGVRMMDELVRVLYTVSWVRDPEYPMEDAMEAVLSGGRVLGKALADEEAYAIMGMVV